jgi:hypothetical protein
MKKIILALATLAAASSVIAADVTAGYGRNFGSDETASSIAIGKQFADFRGEVSLARVVTDRRTANIISFSATNPLTTVGGVSLATKVGVSYVAPLNAVNGYALSAGLEATYPLAKNVTAVATLERVEGQKRINHVDGNQFTVGLRSSF